MVEMAARRPPQVLTTAWLKTLPTATRYAFYGAAAARAAALTVWGAGFSEVACRANIHASRATLWLGPDEYLLLDFGTTAQTGAADMAGGIEGTATVSAATAGRLDGAATASAATANQFESAVAASGATANQFESAVATSDATAGRLESAVTASGATVSRLEAALTGIPHALVDISHRQFALEVSGPHAATLLNGACPLDLDISAFPVGMCTRTVFAKADIVLWRTREDAFHLEVWRSFAGYVGGLLHEIGSEFYPG